MVTRWLRAVMTAVAGVALTETADGADAPQRSLFGIGAYYPPGIGQIATARDLVGPGGWVLILVPAGA